MPTRSSYLEPAPLRLIGALGALFSGIFPPRRGARASECGGTDRFPKNAAPIFYLDPPGWSG